MFVSGRWLSKDKIGIAGGLNQYVAFGNNPVCFIDPFGFVCQVERKGDTVHIYLKMFYEQNGTRAPRAVRRRFNNAIKSYWNRKHGKFDVKVHISDVGELAGSENLNTVHVRTDSARVVGDRTVGYWDADLCKGAVAHEAGHLMGLPDIPPLRNKYPSQRWLWQPTSDAAAPNIMAWYGGAKWQPQVIEQNIQDIIDANLQ